jgi:hypothetical protein
LQDKEDLLRLLAVENEVLSRKVNELELALVALKDNSVPSPLPSRKLKLSFDSFVRATLFPLTGGVVRAIYKRVYRKK